MSDLYKVESDRKNITMFPGLGGSNKDKFEVTVSKNALKHISKSLTDMYKDPVVATIRETISNALDASKRAGTDKLVEIQRPSALVNIFSVTDHGTGMSRKVFMSNFASYGEGTKSDDLDQIGAFGLGAKAPLSLVDSFRVVTVHDGEILEAVITRTADGIDGDIVNSGKTDKPNGTTISMFVPTTRIDAFNAEIDKYVEMSIQTPICVDGVNHYGDTDAFVALPDISLTVDNDVMARVWIRENSVSQYLNTYAPNRNMSMIDDSHFVYVLAGASYFSNYGYYTPSYENRSFIIELVPGVVDFPSSRDSIVNNDRFTSLTNHVKSQLSNNSGVIAEILADYALSVFNPLVTKHGNKNKNYTHVLVDNKDNVILSSNVHRIVRPFEKLNVSSKNFVESMRRLDSFKIEGAYTTAQSNMNNAYLANTSAIGRALNLKVLNPLKMTISDYRQTLDNLKEKGEDLVITDAYLNLRAFNKLTKLLVVTGVDDDTKNDSLIKMRSKIVNTFAKKVSIALVEAPSLMVISVKGDSITAQEKKDLNLYFNHFESIEYFSVDALIDHVKKNAKPKPKLSTESIDVRVYELNPNIHNINDFYNRAISDYSSYNGSYEYANRDKAMNAGSQATMIGYRSVLNLNEIDSDDVILYSPTLAAYGSARGGLSTDEWFIRNILRYAFTVGFEKFKNSNIYFIRNRPLKAVAEVLFESGATIIRGDSSVSFLHTSVTVQDTAKKLPMHFDEPASLRVHVASNLTSDQIDNLLLMKTFDDNDFFVLRTDLKSAINSISYNSNKEYDKATKNLLKDLTKLRDDAERLIELGAGKNNVLLNRISDLVEIGEIVNNNVMSAEADSLVSSLSNVNVNYLHYRDYANLRDNKLITQDIVDTYLEMLSKSITDKSVFDMLNKNYE